MTSINNENYFFPHWHPESWKQCFQKQIPIYKNELSLKESLTYLKNADKLVFDKDISLLKSLFIEAEKGNVFILQAGDCAETFESCNLSDVKKRINHLENLRILLANKINKEVVLIGRMAGQYAKPRTEQFEYKNNSKILSYRGDIINSIHFNEIERIPDPKRLVTAYENAKKTLHWTYHLAHSNFFVSHEALHLFYESALTHYSELSGEWLNYSAHTLWLGERTRDIQGAHVEYLKGIANPIGVKIGPNAHPSEVVNLFEILNPSNSPGKIHFITRFGDNNSLSHLSKIINAIKKSNFNVTWICDPMHGNSFKTENGFKTRNYSNILNEIVNTINIHKNVGTILSGIHLELTYKDVTECIGGNANISENDLHLNYETYCDPRLNKDQSSQIINDFCSQFSD